MNEVFRLYVAAYQYKAVWKDVWKLVKPILSVQIIKDVEVFIHLNPMDSYSTASVILYGSSTPPHGAMFCGQRQHVAANDDDKYSEPTIEAQDTIVQASNNRQSASAMAASKALLHQRKKRPERYVEPLLPLTHPQDSVDAYSQDPVDAWVDTHPQDSVDAWVDEELEGPVYEPGGGQAMGVRTIGGQETVVAE